MSRFLEFVANHPVLWTLFGILLVAWLAVEFRVRAPSACITSSVSW